MKKARKITMNIGIISFLTVFIILCLVTFSILSLSSAKSNQNMTEKSISHKNDYYELSHLGENFLEIIDSKLYENYKKSSSQDHYLSLIKNLKEIDPNIHINKNIISYQLTLNTQKLYIELEVLYPGKTLYNLQSWDIEPSQEWKSDNSLNIL